VLLSIFIRSILEAGFFWKDVTSFTKKCQPMILRQIALAAGNLYGIRPIPLELVLCKYLEHFLGNDI
ncbi:MAG: hypothetical protein QMD10_09010, partial [Desulfitobacteriaceae bacterium]|nr:hypothetical protein [Desulfitobacteriaceae bacterium]